MLYVAGSKHAVGEAKSFHAHLKENNDLPSTFEAAFDRHSKFNRIVVLDLQNISDVDEIYLKGELALMKDLLTTSGVGICIPKSTDDLGHLATVVTAINNVFGRRPAGGKVCFQRQVMLEFSPKVDRRGHSTPNAEQSKLQCNTPAFLLGGVPLEKAQGLLKHALTGCGLFATCSTLNSLPQLSTSTQLHSTADEKKVVFDRQRGATFYEKLLFVNGLKSDVFAETSGDSVVVLDLAPALGCLAVSCMVRGVPYIGRWLNTIDVRGNDVQKFVPPTYERLVSHKTDSYGYY